MTSGAEWNLEMSDYSSIQVTQISVVQYESENQTTASQLRLLVLSHQIAHSGTPAFYLDTAPSYSEDTTKAPVVIVFDVFSNFSNFEIPFWCTSASWAWKVETLFTETIVSHLQRAMTLYFNYQYFDQNPLYFTTFLLFPGNKNWSEPFLYKIIPILRQNLLCFRHVTQGDLEFICGNRCPPEIGSYILLPPFEHPLCVISTIDKTISAITVEKISITFDLGKPFVVLSHPSKIIPKFFSTDSYKKEEAQLKADPEILCEFDNLEIFVFTDKDLEAFFAPWTQSDISLNSGNDAESLVSILEDPEPTPEQVLSEQLNDQKMRDDIAKAIGKAAQTPSKPCNLTMPVCSTISLLYSDISFSSTQSPINSHHLLGTTHCEFLKLSLPSLLVNANGATNEVSPENIFKKWEADQFQPICGPKDGHFIVFAPSTLDKIAVTSFFTELTHVYKQLSFGCLTVFAKFQGFNFINPNQTVDEIRKFYSQQCLAQYQMYPILTFVIGQPIFDRRLSNPVSQSLITFIPQDAIAAATEVDMRSLAFEIYSRVRIYSPSPEGMLENEDSETMFSKIFFRYRYQSPFLLKRLTTQMSIHIAYDPVSNTSVWTDDTGSTLQHFHDINVQKLSDAVEDVRNTMDKYLDKVTISILAEGITTSLHNELITKMRNVLIFSISPAPYVRVKFEDEDLDKSEDALIYANPEYTRRIEEPYEEASSTCFVVSKNLPSYMVSIYNNGSFDQLKEFVSNMSQLSWLSVKPQYETRLCSYPPHIAGLIQVNKYSVNRVSVFEFLPPKQIL